MNQVKIKYPIEVFEDALAQNENRSMYRVSDKGIVTIRLGLGKIIQITVKDGALQIRGDGPIQIRPKMSNDVEIERCSY